jgi:two-component system chemotaxis sensor kinase CheA
VPASDDLVQDFLVECRENLDRFEAELLELERAPGSRECVGRIFRTLHTIKATSGLLGFSTLEGVAHAAESLLSKMRDGKLATTPAILDALLATGDAIRTILRFVAERGTEGQVNYASLLSTLGALQAETGGGPGAPQPQPTAPAPAPPAAARPVEKDKNKERERDREEPAVAPAFVESQVRVDVSLLDQLMNLVGELVLTRNQILQVGPERVDHSLFAACQRLNVVTAELQSKVMKTRMQPIAGVWDKLPRVVRDLAASVGKRVRLETDGRDTELDRTIIDAIKDPLTHLVRNSIDHGIEPPRDRQRAGKPAEGTLRLRAYHEGGRVNIEVSDDGTGLDLERIRSTAVERGFVTAEQAAAMSPREVEGLVFLPGFSTASAVSNVSGRGVGMDVVRTNIERIGGVIDVASAPGRGTTIRINIPLTLAIIPALIVSSAGERYAIPQVSLLELLRLKEGEGRTALEDVHGVAVCRLRGELLPIVHLRRVLDPLSLPPPGVAGVGESGAPSTRAANVVVLQVAERRFGLVVDQINDTQEIVVKSLGRDLEEVDVFAGATIMGDGRVALILDVHGLADRAGVALGAARDGAATATAAPAEVAERRRSLLVFQADGRRMAIPLEAVARLEEFPRRTLERLGRHAVVQYRGRVLPLVDASARAGTLAPSDGDERLSVVVLNAGATPVGLAVERIVDVIELAVAADAPAAREPDARGVPSHVIHDKVTELIDLDQLLMRAVPELTAEWSP